MRNRESNRPHSADNLAVTPDVTGEGKGTAMAIGKQELALVRSREQRAIETIRVHALSGLRSSVFKATELYATIKALDPLETYLVELPDHVLRGLRRGEFLWDKTGVGLLKATIRNARTGAIEKQVRLRRNQANLSALRAMNEFAIHSQLGEIVARLEAIDAKIEHLLASVTDDRCGKIDAGLSLYHLGIAMEDLGRRQHLLLQALPLLAEGRAQLLRSVHREVTSLEPPSDLELILKSRPLARGPLDDFVDRFKVVAANTAMAMGATRAMVIILEACGEWSAARLAVDQLVDATEGYSDRAVALEAFIPSSKSEDLDQVFWKLTCQQLIELTPGRDSGEQLSILTSFSPTELTVATR